MRAINHAMTGALIGLASGQPAVALPAALVSHFVLDVIPHHGVSNNDDQVLRQRWFIPVLAADALLCGLLVLALAIRQPLHWQLAALCAFVAASPDFLFVNRFIKARHRQPNHLSKFVQWTRDIQWFQRPVGAVVEVAWFIAAITLLLTFF